MEIVDFLHSGVINVDLKETTKVGVISELVSLLYADKKITDESHIIDVLLERENLGSTGIGDGIALPHGKSDSVDQLLMALGISQGGIEYDALDQEKVHIFFLLVAPKIDPNNLHLKCLARLSRLLKNEEFRQKLRQVKTAEDVITTIKTIEQG